MKNDFELIVKTINEKAITIYPISDVHLGSLEHNSKEWELFLERIKKEENSYVVLVGDLINNSTRSSVSNVFEEVMRPMEQKRKMCEYLEPIKDKILCAVSGNHERRSLKDADDEPTYDIMCKLNLEDCYRQNIAFLKIQLGSEREKAIRKCTTYTFALTHGSSANKVESFGYAIDNLDCLITGHTHKGVVTKPSKLVIDPRNDVVVVKPFTCITTQSWQSYGGYATQKMLFPQSNADSKNGQRLILLKKEKLIKVVW